MTINCETCGKSFTKQRYNEQHKRTHAVRKEMVQYDCKFCDKMFASNRSLGKHVAKHHPNPRRVENAAIGFMVLGYSPPRNPIPTKQKIYSCKQCPYVTGRTAKLNKTFLKSFLYDLMLRVTSNHTIIMLSPPYFCHFRT